MQPITLLATDLDGTIVGEDGAIAAYTRLGELLSEYRARFGTQWVVCSGRSRTSIERAIEPLRILNLEPDYAVARGSHVYHIRNGHLRAKHAWNWGVRLQMGMRYFYLRGALREWNQDIQQLYKGCTPLYRKANQLCLRFRNREDADGAATLLKRKARIFRHLRVYQHVTEVEVRSVTDTKGMAVELLAARLGIRPSGILCIGNGLRDVSMLDGMIASQCGCPANAELDVMEVVHRAGGYIASSVGVAGVVDILDGYLRGDIQSELPPWWGDQHRSSKPPRSNRNRGRHHHPMGMRSERRAICLAVLVVYATAIVFASFSLLPFSRWILLPFSWVAKLVERALTLFWV